MTRIDRYEVLPTPLGQHAVVDYQSDKYRIFADASEAIAFCATLNQEAISTDFPRGTLVVDPRRNRQYVVYGYVNDYLRCVNAETGSGDTYIRSDIARTV